MKILLGKEAEKMLRLPAAKSEYVKDSAHMVKIAKKFNFPLVLKLVSEKAIHKTEAKGVRIVNNEAELRRHYIEIAKIAKRLKGKIMAQEFVKGKELIIGIKKDPVFGHAIMFGIGGTLVEALRDVSFRICPINVKDAESMVNELKYKNLLLGFRGEKSVNMKLIKNILVKISKLPLKNKKISELDINPLIANDKLAKIIDVRIKI